MDNTWLEEEGVAERKTQTFSPQSSASAIPSKQIFSLRPKVVLDKSPILKQLTADFIVRQNQDILNLQYVITIHKKFRGNFWNYATGILNIFNSKELLSSFHKTAFGPKIQEICLNNVLTQEQFQEFLSKDMDIGFSGEKFKALLHQYNKYLDGELLKVLNVCKITSELNVLLWMCKHFSLEEHLFIINDIIRIGDELSWDQVFEKQQNSCKRLGNMLRRKTKKEK